MTGCRPQRKHSPAHVPEPPRFARRGRGSARRCTLRWRSTGSAPRGLAHTRAAASSSAPAPSSQLAAPCRLSRPRLRPPAWCTWRALGMSYTLECTVVGESCFVRAACEVPLHRRAPLAPSAASGTALYTVHATPHAHPQHTGVARRCAGAPAQSLLPCHQHARRARPCMEAAQCHAGRREAVSTPIEHRERRGASVRGREHAQSTGPGLGCSATAAAWTAAAQCTGIELD
jgi:hypothetical protein